MKIAVAGGTGTVGKHVMAQARERGHQTANLSRASGVDLLTGVGLPEALVDVDVVIDVCNLSTTLSAKKSKAFFAAETGNLLAAEEKAGVAHHVVLSIVGIDSIDVSYYAGKLFQEHLVSQGTIPHSIVRAGQFHEFAGQLLAGMKGPIAFMPKAPIRPVAASEVATYLLDVALGEAQGRASDLVGPRDEILADLARRLLEHRNSRQKVIELRLPGAYWKGLASGSLRGDSSAIEGTLSFDAWLRSQAAGVS